MQNVLCLNKFSKHVGIDVGLKGVLGDSHLKSNLLGIINKRGYTLDTKLARS